MKLAVTIRAFCAPAPTQAGVAPLNFTHAVAASETNQLAVLVEQPPSTAGRDDFAAAMAESILEDGLGDLTTTTSIQARGNRAYSNWIEIATQSGLGTASEGVGVRLAAVRFLGLSGSNTGLTQPAWEAFAVGSTCAFHVSRDGLVAFPLSDPEVFAHVTHRVGATADAGKEMASLGQVGHGSLAEGDFIFLANAVLAQWLLRATAADARLWPTLFNLDANGFMAMVRDLQAQGALRPVDMTLVRVRVHPAT